MIIFVYVEQTAMYPNSSFSQKNQNQLKRTTKRFFQLKVVFKKMFPVSFVTQQANWKH